MDDFKKGFDEVLKATESFDDRSKAAWVLYDFIASIDVSMRQSLIESGKIRHKDLDTAYNQYMGESPRKVIALTYQSAMVHAAQFIQMLLGEVKAGALAQVSDECKDKMKKLSELKESPIIAP